LGENPYHTDSRAFLVVWRASGVFAGVFGAVGALAFGPMIEE